ncbi:MAG: hypothetical protein ACPLRZ_11545 [Thermovenabulum sp.]|uniref:hypothetical protein n=1 Tax=Thermovenabulum sp. TaxID=3100335 RepID=UPI003C79A804
MYCRNCGEKLEDNSEICPKCKTPVKKKTKTIFLPKRYIMYAAIILAIIFVITLLRPAKPEDIAKNFLTALRTSDYNKAYSMLHFEGQNYSNVFLTKDDFIKAMKDKEKIKGKITNIDLDTQQDVNEINNLLLNTLGTTEMKTKYSKDKYKEYLGYITRENGNNETIQLFLLNTGSKRWPKWKIIGDNLSEIRTIETYPEIKVFVNDKEINPKNPGFYQYKCFIGFSPKYKLTADLIQPVEFENNENYIRFYDFEPSEKIKEEITNLINNFIEADIKASKELDPSYYEPFVSKQPVFLTQSLYDRLSYNINNMKNYGYYLEANLVDINYEEIKFFNSLNEITLLAKETWKYVKKNTTDNSIIEEKPSFTVKWQFNIRKENNKWVIYDMNNRSYF